MRVAVITGGMGGLGESISTKMHAAGYRVVVTHSPGNTRAKDWLAEQSAARRNFSAYGVDVKYRTGFWRGRPMRTRMTELVRALGELSAEWIGRGYTHDNGPGAMNVDECASSVVVV